MTSWLCSPLNMCSSVAKFLPLTLPISSNWLRLWGPFRTKRCWGCIHRWRQRTSVTEWQGTKHIWQHLQNSLQEDFLVADFSSLISGNEDASVPFPRYHFPPGGHDMTVKTVISVFSLSFSVCPAGSLSLTVFLRSLSLCLFLLINNSKLIIKSVV